MVKIARVLGKDRYIYRFSQSRACVVVAIKLCKLNMADEDERKNVLSISIDFEYYLLEAEWQPESENRDSEAAMKEQYNIRNPLVSVFSSDMYSNTK